MANDIRKILTLIQRKREELKKAKEHGKLNIYFLELKKEIEIYVGKTVPFNRKPILQTCNKLLRNTEIAIRFLNSPPVCRFLMLIMAFITLILQILAMVGLAVAFISGTSVNQDAENKDIPIEPDQERVCKTKFKHPEH